MNKSMLLLLALLVGLVPGSDEALASDVICGLVDDQDAHVPPYYTGSLPIEQPGLGGTIHDLAYGPVRCPIKRVTDGAAGPGNPSGVWHHYSTFSASNADGSLILAHKASPDGSFIVDRDGNIVRDSIPTLPSECTSRVFEWMEPRWSPTDPDKIYYHSSWTCATPNRVYVYSVSGDESLLLGEFSQYTFVNFGHSTAWANGESAVSPDGRYIVLGGGFETDPNAPLSEFRLLDLESCQPDPNGCILSDPIHGGNSTPDLGDPKMGADWCDVTPVKNNIICRFGYQGSYDRIELFQGFSPTGTPASGAHLADVLDWGAHADRGIDLVDADMDGENDEILVIINHGTQPDASGGCSPPGIEKVRIPGGERTCLFEGVSGAVHLSVNSRPVGPTKAPEHPWALVSTYSYASLEDNDGLQTCTLTTGWNNMWGLYENELTLVKLDGSEVRRLAHHRTREANSHAALGYDGKHAVFTSNFGEQCGGSIAGDVFALQIASHCNGDLTCDAGEDCKSCPSDCIGTPICGNGVCEAGMGESSDSCRDDCKKNCGPVSGEGALCSEINKCNNGGYTCTDVHGPSYCCGDGVCEGAEDPMSCPVHDVNVLSPNGGEVLEINDQIPLQWTATAECVDIQDVDLSLSRNGQGGAFSALFTAIPNTGETTWTVTGPVTTDGVLRIVAPHAGSFLDQSDDEFSIIVDQECQPCTVSYCADVGLRCTHNGSCGPGACCAYDCTFDETCEAADPLPPNACS